MPARRAAIFGSVVFGPALLGPALTAVLAPLGSARAVTITLVNVDAADVGFNDTAEAEPLGDNPGTTLGEQRWNAATAAAQIWESALSGAVPVVVEVSFAPVPELGCSAEDIVLAQTAVTAYAANQGTRYPIALANQLAGADLVSGFAHVVTYFNDAFGDSARCPRDGTWYYGLDGAPPPGDVDLVTTFAHELAHGFGIATDLDLTTGNFPGVPDAFSRLIVDSATDQTLADMSAAERLFALSTPRSLVWTGARGRADAVAVLARGLPRVAARGAGGTGFVSSELVAEVLPAPETEAVTAPLTLIGSNMLCIGRGLVTDRIVVVDDELCSAEDKYRTAAELGAAALVIADAALVPVPLVLVDDAPALLALVVARADYDALAELPDGTTGRVFRDPSRLVGADARGRPYLDTGAPILAGTTLTHLDALARRAVPIAGNAQLLLEPTGGAALLGDVALAQSLLEDLGWGTEFCGNGELDSGEECDSGPDRSDATPGECRRDCRLPSCGDAALDTDESCDNGGLNSDELSDACREDCTLPRCGDGVADFLANEACDDGTENGDTESNCRADCTFVLCGDGNVDGAEECDDGSANGDEPNACRTSCENPRCGDGVVDPLTESDGLGESCDDGNLESGDGCSAACADEVAPGTFDAGVVPSLGGSGPVAAPDAGPLPDVTPPEFDAGVEPLPGPGWTAKPVGCGCRTATRGRTESGGPTVSVLWCLSALLRRRRPLRKSR